MGGLAGVLSDVMVAAWFVAASKRGIWVDLPVCTRPCRRVMLFSEITWRISSLRWEMGKLGICGCKGRILDVDRSGDGVGRGEVVAEFPIRARQARRMD